MIRFCQRPPSDDAWMVQEPTDKTLQSAGSPFGFQYFIELIDEETLIRDRGDADGDSAVSSPVGVKLVSTITRLPRYSKLKSG